MSRPFKRKISTYQLPDGKHRTPDGKRVTSNTPGAVKATKESEIFYGKYRDAAGILQVAPLCADKQASKQMLAKLATDGSLGSVGLLNPFSEHHKRPLREHMDDFKASLTAKGTSVKQVAQVTARVRTVLAGCKFIFMADLSASRVQSFVAELRQSERTRKQLDPAKQLYTKSELAEVLGIKPSTVNALVRRHRLEAVGNGKARRFPRNTAEALQDLLCRGRGIQTSNFYLGAIKQFCRWLVRDRRMADSPLAHLSGGNVKVDRRHDRRPLSEEELRHVLETARASVWEFRNLSGEDRHILYVTACVTGLRRFELSTLTPESFSLTTEPPTVTVRAGYTKNHNLAVQPIPPDVAAVLGEYLMGKASNAPVWPGNWSERAAEMLQHDLEEAGIPYVVDGPDGPLFADFHALRHSYVALLDRSGASLKQAMQLARHSDPKLTMARYGRAQIHDLSAAVDRMPSLLKTVTSPETEVLTATGTGGAFTAPLMRLHQTGEFACDSLSTLENLTLQGDDLTGIEKPLKTSHLRADENDCDQLSVIRPAGFEPATLGLGNRGTGDVTLESETAFAANPQRRDGAFTKQLSEPALRNPDLARVVAAWPTLPEHIKAAVLALVGTAARPGI